MRTGETVWCHESNIPRLKVQFKGMMFGCKPTWDFYIQHECRQHIKKAMAIYWTYKWCLVRYISLRIDFCLFLFKWEESTVNWIYFERGWAQSSKARVHWNVMMEPSREQLMVKGKGEGELKSVQDVVFPNFWGLLRTESHGRLWLLMLPPWNPHTWVMEWDEMKTEKWEHLVTTGKIYEKRVTER